MAIPRPTLGPSYPLHGTGSLAFFSLFAPRDALHGALHVLVRLTRGLPTHELIWLYRCGLLGISSGDAARLATECSLSTPMGSRETTRMPSELVSRRSYTQCVLFSWNVDGS
jgi:hypothetical protein